MQQSERDIRAKAAQAHAKETALVAVDTWTPVTTGRPGYRIRTEPSEAKKQPWAYKIDSMFSSAIGYLNNSDFIWLTAESHWLDRREITILAPQGADYDDCWYRNKNCKSHEQAALEQPGRHARFNGMVSLARHDAITLVATVRKLDGLHSAMTVQLREKQKPWMIAALGETNEIIGAASFLHGYLARRQDVVADMKRMINFDPLLSARFDPLHFAGVRRISIDPHDMIKPYRMAGSEGTPERLYWLDAGKKEIEGLHYARLAAHAFVPPMLKAG